jgi:starch-binding outer membrane protein SusE/F
MNKKLSIYLVLIGLLGLLFSCEKDETKVVILSNPIAPTIQTVPELNFTRATGLDTIVIVGTNVDPGFVASANYYLEADTTGNDFQNPVILASTTSALKFKFSVSDLNGLCIKKFPTDIYSTVDFRIRCVLVKDAGTGFQPIVSISETKTVSLHTYGLPRLDLIGSGINQKVVSPLGDGKYFGFVKLAMANPFTLKDSETDTIYGNTGGHLAVEGDGISSAADGWYKFNADLNDHSFSMEAYFIGLVGTATPNNWDTPDQKMDYDSRSETWSITIDLKDGELKFRLNDGWSWNLGGTPDNLTHNGSNVAVTAGNYTVTLKITNPTPGVEAGTCTLVKNN